MVFRTATALALCITLSGCSSSYELKAILVDGTIAFTPVDTNIWGKPEPDCFYSISVAIVDGPAATPSAGENVGSVTNGTYWNQTFAVTSCENSFPVVYGAELSGPPFRANYDYNVIAKPLLRGFVYEVSASSNGSEYGGGKFKLTEEGFVENLNL